MSPGHESRSLFQSQLPTATTAMLKACIDWMMERQQSSFFWHLATEQMLYVMPFIDCPDDSWALVYRKSYCAHAERPILPLQEKYNDVASELIVYTYFFSAPEEVFPEVTLLNTHPFFELQGKKLNHMIISLHGSLLILCSWFSILSSEVKFIITVFLA